MQKSIKNCLRQWDFCTPESLSYGLCSKCTDLLNSYDYSLDKAAELGCGALCFEGNIHFYEKSGFTFASEFGIRYHNLPKDADASFFLCKELIPGYLSGVTGEYTPPQGYEKTTDLKVIMSGKAMYTLKRGQNSFEGGCSTLLAWIFCKLMGLVGKAEHRF